MIPVQVWISASGGLIIFLALIYKIAVTKRYRIKMSGITVIDRAAFIHQDLSLAFQIIGGVMFLSGLFSIALSSIR